MPMNTVRRREFLQAIAGGLACSGLADAQARRPNIVMIVTDDHGVGDVGCFGYPEVRTPNLDRLAASGMRFTQWYSNAPVCSASRASIMTGRYSERTGVFGALRSEPE